MLSWVERVRGWKRVVIFKFHPIDSRPIYGLPTLMLITYQLDLGHKSVTDVLSYNYILYCLSLAQGLPFFLCLKATSYSKPYSSLERCDLSCEMHTFFGSICNLWKWTNLEWLVWTHLGVWSAHISKLDTANCWLPPWTSGGRSTTEK